ncbi:MAG: zinc ribbon domain-containing protein [Desulfobacteraceae bacterium]|nr:MAG: zinc ribbon domain-containing protein [Desulfobacteraceae bacterium]
MPIYEYKCLNCEKEFETLVFGGDDKVSCPHCKRDKLERLMSTCGFKSSESFTPASGSSGCSSCSRTNCSSCH